MSAVTCPLHLTQGTHRTVLQYSLAVADWPRPLHVYILLFQIAICYLYVFLTLRYLEGTVMFFTLSFKIKKIESKILKGKCCNNSSKCVESENLLQFPISRTCASIHCGKTTPCSLDIPAM